MQRPQQTHQHISSPRAVVRGWRIKLLHGLDCVCSIFVTHPQVVDSDDEEPRRRRAVHLQKIQRVLQETTLDRRTRRRTGNERRVARGERHVRVVRVQREQREPRRLHQHGGERVAGFAGEVHDHQRDHQRERRDAGGRGARLGSPSDTKRRVRLLERGTPSALTRDVARPDEERAAASRPRARSIPCSHGSVKLKKSLKNTVRRAIEREIVPAPASSFFTCSNTSLGRRSRAINVTTPMACPEHVSAVSLRAAALSTRRGAGFSSPPFTSSPSRRPPSARPRRAPEGRPSGRPHCEHQRRRSRRMQPLAEERPAARASKAPIGVGLAERRGLQLRARRHHTRRASRANPRRSRTDRRAARSCARRPPAPAAGGDASAQVCEGRAEVCGVDGDEARVRGRRRKLFRKLPPEALPEAPFRPPHARAAATGCTLRPAPARSAQLRGRYSYALARHRRRRRRASRRTESGRAARRTPRRVSPQRRGRAESARLLPAR